MVNGCLVKDLQHFSDRRPAGRRLGFLVAVGRGYHDPWSEKNALGLNGDVAMAHGIGTMDESKRAIYNC